MIQSMSATSRGNTAFGRWNITIVDSDFTEVIVADNYWKAIIKVYGKRNLNIPANLALGIILNQSVSINNVKQIVSKITDGKYDEEIEKYLMLI